MKCHQTCRIDPSFRPRDYNPLFLSSLIMEEEELQILNPKVQSFPQVHSVNTSLSQKWLPQVNNPNMNCCLYLISFLASMFSVRCPILLLHWIG